MTTGADVSAAGGSPSRRHRPPAELIAVVVLTYVAGFVSIAVGILLILARYVTDITALGGPFGTTLLGSFVVLFGLFIIALASALTRGKHYARVATTIALAVQIGLGVVALFVTAASMSVTELWSEIVLVVVAALMILVLWAGRTGRYFAHVSERDAALRRAGR